jgi:intracellular multiplication protein IcmE
MGSAANSFAPSQSVLVGDTGPREPLATEPGDGAESIPADMSDAGDIREVEIETIMYPGDILYGETLNYVTSDLATPVLVRLTTGPFAGARLTGSFQVDNASKKLFIGFTTITFEDGATVPIQAFAVDGYTSASTVASDVNNRYLARYGAIMASAFVAGFADSAATAGESVVTSGDNTIVSGVAPTTEQSLFAGVAAAGSVIADDIAGRAPKGPEIVIRGGYPVGILIVAPVTIETEAGAQDD